QRTAVRGINRYGRLSQGVKVMNVRDDDMVQAVAVVFDSDDEDQETTMTDPLDRVLEGENLAGEPAQPELTPDEEASPGTQINESDIDDPDESATPTTEDDVT